MVTMTSSISLTWLDHVGDALAVLQSSRDREKPEKPVASFSWKSR
jgi:hypothetical protein